MNKLIGFIFIILLLAFPVSATVEFNGTDNYINCGSDSSIDNMSPWTVAAWINPDNVGEGTTGRIIDKRAADNSGYQNFYVSSSDSNGLGFSRDTTSGEMYAKSGGLSFDAYQHAAVTWDGGFDASEDVIFYIDGDVEAHTADQDGGGSVDSNADGNLYIGNRAANDRTFDGELSELYMWDVVLTPAEIKILADSKVKGIGLQIQPDHLIAYWPLDDEPDGESTDGDTFRDSSSNTNTGTASGGTAKAEEVLSHP